VVQVLHVGVIRRPHPDLVDAGPPPQRVGEGELEAEQDTKLSETQLGRPVPRGTAVAVNVDGAGASKVPDALELSRENDRDRGDMKADPDRGARVFESLGVRPADACASAKASESCR
jgi:hypothetical protein